MSFMVRALTAVCLCVVALVGCYTHRRLDDGGPGDGAADGGLPDTGVWPDADHWWPDAEPIDVGPACPDAGVVVESLNCDVFAQNCPLGTACYGWIEYTEDPCVREIYHMDCMEPGYGGPGDPCDQWCQAGLECFVTGAGTQCLLVCDILGGLRQCPAGQICRPTDLPGLGACE